MATGDAVLKRLEQKGAEADQIIEYLKQQVALLKEKASKKIWKFVSFLGRYLKWIHMVMTKKKMCLPQTVLLHSLDDDFCIPLMLQLWVKKYSGIKIS